MTRARATAAFALAIAPLLLALGGSAHAQTPTLELHEVRFFVHQDVAATFDQATVNEALLDARLLLQGEQGPFDTACCADIRSVSLTTFSGANVGRPPGDLNHVFFHMNTDEPDLETIAAGQPAVFLVDSLTSCGGTAGAIGCAETPMCGQPKGNVAVVTLDAFESGLFGATLAHEIGHNVCRQHVTQNTCELMRATAGGGCLSTAECTSYRTQSTSSSGVCPCHWSTTMVEPDGMGCFEGSAGICSGGVCEPISSPASSKLFASADPTFAGFDGDIGSALYDDGVRISGTPGDWKDELDFDPSVRPTGMAYDPDAQVLYAIGPGTLGNSILYEIDPETGGTLAQRGVNGIEAIALAFDPGATSGTGDDRLFTVDRYGAGGSQINEDLISVVPATGVPTTLCNLANNSQNTSHGFFQGLAYDANNDKLYGLGEGGLLDVDTTTCGATPINHPATNATYARQAAGLAWSAQTSDLFLVGNQLGGVTLYDTIYLPGGVEVANQGTFAIDEMTTGGLAALPVPEPGGGALAAAALAAISALRVARRR